MDGNSGMKPDKNVSSQDVPVPSVVGVKRKKGSLQISPPQTMESLKLVQKQLILLLHSLHCLRKELFVIPNHPVCKVRNCVMMQEVWLHLRTCKIGAQCPHQHCLSSLRILAHWKHCEDVHCPVCQLVRLKLNHSLAVGGAGEELHSDNILPTKHVPGQSTSGSQTYQNQGQIFISQCQGQSQPGNENVLDSLSSHSKSHADNAMHFCDRNDSSSSSSHYCSRHNTSHVSNVLTEDPPLALNEAFFPRFESSHVGIQNQYGDSLTSAMVVTQDNASQSAEHVCINCGSRKMVVPIKSLSPPSANDIKRAYEQLGIPCPVDALHRLMATLPGGSQTEEIDNDPIHAATTSRRHRDRDSLDVDTDDGIHVDISSSEIYSSILTALIRNDTGDKLPPLLALPQD